MQVLDSRTPSLWNTRARYYSSQLLASSQRTHLRTESIYLLTYLQHDMHKLDWTTNPQTLFGTSLGTTTHPRCIAHCYMHYCVEGLWGLPSPIALRGQAPGAIFFGRLAVLEKQLAPPKMRKGQVYVPRTRNPALGTAKKRIGGRKEVPQSLETVSTALNVYGV
ncbi:hypothetical protein B0H17DRAFT_1130086 [Mycena rosella]|uniref:Uncharacterized protein n=1 Tax=Mycena rosella TaxID=1033263 RepID=A0AAD7DT84_MYCRO|nr:hypothetical protein B0H17DRAFT_1130086 [Mycena rosella]